MQKCILKNFEQHCIFFFRFLQASFFNNFLVVLCSGAAEGPGQPQVRGPVHQPEECRLPADGTGVGGGVGAAGRPEGDELSLWSTGRLAGGLEGGASEGAHAVSGSGTCRVLIRCLIFYVHLLFDIFPATCCVIRSSTRRATVSCCGWRTSTAGGTKWCPSLPTWTAKPCELTMEH